jgi:hypothetical protein
VDFKDARAYHLQTPDDLDAVPEARSALGKLSGAMWYVQGITG